MVKSRLQLRIFGSSFTVQSSEDAAHLSSVVACFKKRIKEIREKLPVADPLKVSLLAGLNLADDLLKERSKDSRPGQLPPELGSGSDAPMAPVAGGAQSDDSLEIERITARMISQIDESLETAEPKKDG